MHTTRGAFPPLILASGLALGLTGRGAAQDGYYDLGWGSGGRVLVEDSQATYRPTPALAVQPDGSLLMGGPCESAPSDGSTDGCLYRIDASGLRDSAFGNAPGGLLRWRSPGLSVEDEGIHRVRLVPGSAQGEFWIAGTELNSRAMVHRVSGDGNWAALVWRSADLQPVLGFDLPVCALVGPEADYDAGSGALAVVVQHTGEVEPLLTQRLTGMGSWAPRGSGSEGAVCRDGAWSPDQGITLVGTQRSGTTATGARIWRLLGDGTPIAAQGGAAGKAFAPTTGRNYALHAVAHDARGGTLVAGRGQFYQALLGTWRRDAFVARLLPGSDELDPGFGNNGMQRLFLAWSDVPEPSWLWVAALLVQRDGRLLVVASMGGNDHFTVTRLTPDGQFDPGFGASGRTAGTLDPAARSGILLASGAALDPRGDGFYVIGEFAPGGIAATPRFGAARILSTDLGSPTPTDFRDGFESR